MEVESLPREAGIWDGIFSVSTLAGGSIIGVSSPFPWTELSVPEDKFLCKYFKWCSQNLLRSAYKLTNDGTPRNTPTNSCAHILPVPSKGRLHMNWSSSGSAKTKVLVISSGAGNVEPAISLGGMVEEGMGCKGRDGTRLREANVRVCSSWSSWKPDFESSASSTGRFLRAGISLLREETSLLVSLAGISSVMRAIRFPPLGFVCILGSRRSSR